MVTLFGLLSEKWIRGICLFFALLAIVSTLVIFKSEIVKIVMYIVAFLYSLGALYPPLGKVLLSDYVIEW